MQGTDAV